MPHHLAVVQRLKSDPGVVAAARFTVYDPEVTAGILAAGLGAGSMGSGGRATGMVLDDIVTWGRHAKAELLPLPHQVVAVVDGSGLTLREWRDDHEVGRVLVRWSAATFHATIKRRHLAGEVEVWLVSPEQHRAVLTAKSGSWHHDADVCAEEIVRASSPPPT